MSGGKTRAERRAGIPLGIAAPAAHALGRAPFPAEPHFRDKLKMLAAGTPDRPVDVFDPLLHEMPWGLLIAKLARMAIARTGHASGGGIWATKKPRRSEALAAADMSVAFDVAVAERAGAVSMRKCPPGTVPARVSGRRSPQGAGRSRARALAPAAP